MEKKADLFASLCVTYGKNGGELIRIPYKLLTGLTASEISDLKASAKNAGYESENNAVFLTVDFKKTVK